MLEITKSYVLDKDQKPIAVQTLTTVFSLLLSNPERIDNYGC